MTRERASEADSAIIWSGPRMLSADEVADGVIGLLDSKKLLLGIPRWRVWAARLGALSGRSGLRLSERLRQQGERKRARG
jgi:hypothetical protein